MKKFLLSLCLATLALSALAVSRPSKANMPGTWLLNGKDKSTRFVFKKDGSFSYAGWGATSQGKWYLNEEKLTLVWSHIDKQKVKPGTVKGTFNVVQGTLQIDKHKYRRVS